MKEENQKSSREESENLFFGSHMSAQVTVTVVLLLILAGLVLQIYVKKSIF